MRLKKRRVWSRQQKARRGQNPSALYIPYLWDTQFMHNPPSMASIHCDFCTALRGSGQPLWAPGLFPYLQSQEPTLAQMRRPLQASHVIRMELNCPSLCSGLGFLACCVNGGTCQERAQGTERQWVSQGSRGAVIRAGALFCSAWELQWAQAASFAWGNSKSYLGAGVLRLS